jgi:ABC-type glycerol-3-phosphate transport system substrate-binding protein
MKKSIALALALLLMLALCACGGEKADPAVGTWEIRSMTSGEETLSVDEVPALKNYIVIELKADGTGTITSGGETLPLTWDATTITVEGDPANYKVSGDELTITSGQLSFVLARR